VSIKSDKYNQVTVIAIEGDLAGDGAIQAAKAFDESTHDAAASQVVFDLEKTQFIDSQGLEVLTRSLARCESRGGKAILASPSDHCRKVLELTRLDKRFETHANVPAALKSLR
jgi:anti-anti-sigma factor